MSTADLARLPAAPPGRIVTGNLICMASMMIWAAGFPAAERLLDTWHPLILIAARFVVAMALLLPVWLLLEGAGALRRAPWGRGLWIGGLGFGLGAWLLLAAQALTDPVTVAVISAAAPIAAVLIELAARTRTLRWPLVLGLAASVLGGVVATGAGPSTGEGLWAGVGLAVLACFLFSWGSHRTVAAFPDQTGLGRTVVTLAGGLVVTLVLAAGGYALGHVPAPIDPWSAETLALLAVYGTAALALSQVLWIIAVARLGVGIAALHINVAPFYVMLILVALGGSWSWPQAAGALIVALGVVLAQR